MATRRPSPTFVSAMSSSLRGQTRSGISGLDRHARRRRPRHEVAGARLLIHCQHGIGRSALVALCVLVDRGAAPMAALRRAKDAREKISPAPCQFEAWAEWIARRAPQHRPPSFEDYARVAYRHLHGQS